MGPIPEMTPLPEMQVRVKNTFLELVEDDEVQPRILKSKTDSLAMRPPYPNSDEASAVGGLPLLGASSCGTAMATAAAAASAAMAAARAAAAVAAVPQCLAAVGGLPMAGFGELPPLEAMGLAARPAGKPAENAERSKPKNRVQDRAARVTDAAQAGEADETGLTTVMLRNLPNDYSRSMLLELMNASGFMGRYDFLYLPTDFSRRAGLGYAFVNMVTPADAQEVRRQLEGFRKWCVPSSKVCSVGWSNPCQGLEANIERYKNSPIMHESVPDEFKPMVFVDGVRARFPQPTKKLRKPDMGKHGRQRT